MISTSDALMATLSGGQKRDDDDRGIVLAAM